MFTIKLNGKFFANSGNLVDTFEEARNFSDYDEVHATIKLYRLLQKGHVEVFGDYGTENEFVEDI